MIDLILVFIVALIIGIKLGAYAYEKELSKLLEKEIEKELDKQQSQESDMIEVLIEKHDQTYFVYKKKDSSYIAHGNTLLELENCLRINYPNKKFYADKGSFSVLADTNDVSI